MLTFPNKYLAFRAWLGDNDAVRLSFGSHSHLVDLSFGPTVSQSFSLVT